MLLEQTRLAAKRSDGPRLKESVSALSASAADVARSRGGTVSRASGAPPARATSPTRLARRPSCATCWSACPSFRESLVGDQAAGRADRGAVQAIPETAVAEPDAVAAGRHARVHSRAAGGRSVGSRRRRWWRSRRTDPTRRRVFAAATASRLRRVGGAPPRRSPRPSVRRNRRARLESRLPDGPRDRRRGRPAAADAGRRRDLRGRDGRRGRARRRDHGRLLRRVGGRSRNGRRRRPRRRRDAARRRWSCGTTATAPGVSCSPLPASSICVDSSWGDFDGDGDPDAALLDAQGVLHVFENRQAGQFREMPKPGDAGARGRAWRSATSTPTACSTSSRSARTGRFGACPRRRRRRGSSSRSRSGRTTVQGGAAGDVSAVSRRSRQQRCARSRGVGRRTVPRLARRRRRRISSAAVACPTATCSASSI